MHAYLAKTASLLMAIVMVASTSLCRCGIAACHTVRATPTAQHHIAIPSCANHCSDEPPRSTDGDSPARCPDCAKTKIASERQAAATASSFKLNSFTTPAVGAILTSSASPPSLNVRTEHVDPPIAVLLQSCILLI